MRTAVWPGQVLRFASLESTNLHAAGLVAAGRTDEFAVVAGEQSAGRGRLGRSWFSPGGLGMYCSVVCRPRAPRERYPQLTLVAATAAVEAAAAVGGGALSIKWPNDLFHRGRKVGGILSEIVPSPGGEPDSVVVGVGMNVLQKREDFPEEIRDTASSLAEISGGPVDVESLVAAFLDAFHAWRLVWERDGFEPVRARWLRCNCTVGRTVVIGGDGPGATALATGMDADGCLSLRDAQGRDFTIVAGDVVAAESVMPEPPQLPP